MWTFGPCSSSRRISPPRYGLLHPLDEFVKVRAQTGLRPTYRRLPWRPLGDTIAGRVRSESCALSDRAFGHFVVSPKAAKEAGDKFGLKPSAPDLTNSSSGCSRTYRGGEIRRLLDKDNVHIDRITYLPIMMRPCGWPT